MNGAVRARHARLSAIIVSANSARWLRPCLGGLLAASGSLEIEVIVVAGGCTDETVSLVRREYPDVRLIECENRGFAYGNNRGLVETDAEYVLLVNPDTEFVGGTLDELVAAMDARPDVGIAGVKQLSEDGSLQFAMRRFPTAARFFWEALGCERWQRSLGLELGRRVTAAPAYGAEQRCDWVSGSFMLVRREALLSAGLLDERFFLYFEEPDLSLRVKQAGWETAYLPLVTIVHHGGDVPPSARFAIQDALSCQLYFAKHGTRIQRLAVRSALALGAAIRSIAGTSRGMTRRASRSLLRALVLGFSPPFRNVPPTAVSSAFEPELNRNGEATAVGRGRPSPPHG